MNLTKEQFLDKFQENLSKQFNGTQNWWTKSLFHFTDIKNAISIIENGKIYSRKKAIELNLMENDNANDNVILNTCDEHKQFARLYFGPATPTQKNNEGIKPKDKIVNNAHCPIPIMFVFDFKKIFLLPNIRFTDGNLATNPNVYENIEDLNNLNFNLIYHRSWLQNDEMKSKVINARHSEVIVKDELCLENNLKSILVRSNAEKEFLLFNLSDKTRKLYQDKVFIQPLSGVFTNDWLYIDKILVLYNQIDIYWHKCNNLQCQNKYKLYVELNNLEGTNTRYLLLENWYLENNLLTISLPREFMFLYFKIDIYIDDIKIYSNVIKGE
ncbi:DarT ssDNA thymidine ADP-ribosyltransferase family protein [Aliarcobacter lanthieri]|uniref:DarT ssDNA thymidine ADP-ribosyltransferase family protein n=1 Tax=Aliarcobacter lanthieri TaxID=1355374 RepID=UPI00047A5E5F|nr:DarT ssDNA thymidine ADP-ribosyltransferase family protein [Aliarcobacter lanthieri]QKF58954.1 DUF4433 domain-containing protein [Aliarcobacter lanthieri]